MKIKIVSWPVSRIREVSASNEQRDEGGADVNWQFTTADARIKLKKLYPVLEPTGQIQSNTLLGY